MSERSSNGKGIIPPVNDNSILPVCISQGRLICRRRKNSLEGLLKEVLFLDLEDQVRHLILLARRVKDRMRKRMVK